MDEIRGQLNRKWYSLVSVVALGVVMEIDIRDEILKAEIDRIEFKMWLTKLCQVDRTFSDGVCWGCRR